jgi:hypothetical protein
MIQTSKWTQSLRYHRGPLAWIAWAAISGTLGSAGCAGIRGKNDCSAHGNHCIEKSADVAAPHASLAATQRCVEELPCSSVPAPPGTYVNAWSDAMVAQAAVQGDIITRNLWFDGGEELGPDGRERLIKVSESFGDQPRMILIEEEPVAIAAGQTYADALAANEKLNLERKANVVSGLASLGIPNAEELVYFTKDRSVGVRGIEAPNVFNSQFMGGMGGGLGGRGGGIGGGGFGGGFGGGGFGGGFGGGGFGGGGFGGGGMF